MSAKLVGKFARLKVSAMVAITEFVGGDDWSHMAYIESYDDGHNNYTVFINKLNGSYGTYFTLRRGEFVPCK